MDQIEFELDYDKMDETTVEEAEDHENFVNEINYLLAEGLVRVLADEDGEPHFYPGEWTDKQIMEFLKEE